MNNISTSLCDYSELFFVSWGRQALTAAAVISGGSAPFHL